MYCLFSLLLLVLSLQHVVAQYRFKFKAVDQEGKIYSEKVGRGRQYNCGPVARLTVDIIPKKKPKLDIRVQTVPHNIDASLVISSYGSLVTKPLGSSGDDSHLFEVRHKEVMIKVKSIKIIDKSVNASNEIARNRITIHRDEFFVVNGRTAFIVTEEENEPFGINSNKGFKGGSDRYRTRRNTKPREHSEIAPLKMVLRCIEDGCTAVPEAQSLERVPVRERLLYVDYKERIHSIRHWMKAHIPANVEDYMYEDLDFVLQNTVNGYKCVKMTESPIDPDRRKPLRAEQRLIDESPDEPQGASYQRLRRSSSSSGNRFSRSMSQSSYKSCIDDSDETELKVIAVVHPPPNDATV